MRDTRLMTDEEIARDLAPSKVLPETMVAFLDDKEELIGALSRRGLTKGEAAIVMWLGYLDNDLERIIALLEE